MGVQAKKTPVYFLIDPNTGRSTLQPANIKIYKWSRGKHTSVDVTGVPSMVDIGSGVYEIGHTAMKEKIAKVEKHEKAWEENQDCFH